MRKIQNQIRLIVIMGIVSIFAGILAHLALTDIYHGEGDLTQEWMLLQACAILFFVYIVSSLFVLRNAMRLLG